MGIPILFCYTIFFVTKSEDDIRIYQDYQRLNNIIIKNRYLLLLIKKTLHTFCYIKIHIKLNIIVVFNKLYIAKQYEWRTVFIIRFDLFKSLVMLLRLCNILILFQNYIEYILFDLLNKNYITYLDNNLSYFSNIINYQNQICNIIKQFIDIKFQIDTSINKYEFKTKKTKYLELIIIPKSIKINFKKVKRILK